VDRTKNRLAGKMIKSFRDKETEAVFNGNRSRKLPGDIQVSAQKKLWLLDAVTAPEELRNLPGNRFEALNGRPGFYSIRVNAQWRVTFSWNDGAENVKIEDYH
jgi:proteic killer suppression protein